MPRSKSRRQAAPDPATDAELRIANSRLRFFGVALICAYVSLVPLVFDPAADWPFTVPKALLSHSIAYVLAGVTVGFVIRFGRAALVWSWLHIPIFAFLLVNVVATIFAEDRFLALYGTHARMLGLGTIAAWTALYFGVVTLIRTRSDIAFLVASGLGAAVVMLAYELVQLLGLDPFRWNTDTAVRPFSTNGQATSLAAYLSALALSTFAAMFAVRDVPPWMRLVLFLFSAALLAGAAATGTRSALIGLATGSAVLVVLVWAEHPSRRARLISVATAMAAALGLATVLAFTPIGGRILQVSPVVGDSGEDATQLDLASFDVRVVLYQVAVDIVRERPLLGYGPDNFVVGMTRHRPEQGPNEARLAFATSAHSWVGQVTTGSGLVGLAAFIAIIGGVGLLTARSGFYGVPVASAAGLAAYLGTGLTSVTDVGGDWVFWVGSALIAGCAARMSRDAPAGGRLAESGGGKRARPARRTTWSGIALVAVCLALGIGLGLTSLRAMDASRSARLSQDSRLGGRAGQAVNAGIAATTFDPGRAEYWQRLGLAYVSGARWRDAATALERAVLLAPWDVRYVSDLVQTQLILASDGDGAARARALQLADEGVRRDPNYPPIYFTRAVVMQFVGNVPEAIRSLERAFALAPGSTNAQWYVIGTQLYLAAGRAADAVRVARSGLLVTDSLQIRFEFARALLTSGHAQDALGQIDSVLAAEPGNIAAQRLRAEILAAIPR